MRTSTDPSLFRLRRCGVRIRSGPRAGALANLRSFARFLAASGATAGIRDQGRTRDYMFVLSALKGEAVYRRREIAPVRRVHLVLDARDGIDERLAEAARLIGGLFLVMADCALSFGVWGTRHPYPVQSFRGEGTWPWFARVTAAAAHLPSDPRAPFGALRRCLATDEPAHVALVTGWLEPEALRGLALPLGGTCFAVEPARGWFDRGRVGATDVALALLPSAAAEDRDRERLGALARACAARRIDLVRLSGSAPVLDELEGALNSAAARR